MKGSSAWWGPPKKFDRPQEERRVTWLELFFDLVYVIAIARITHHFAVHVSISSFIEYAILFLLIYWGWLNGSLYYDLHGNEGLRTRLTTLWQMMIISALAITIDQPTEKRYLYIIVVLMIMQIFITYLWWAVGFYDPSHRRYNKPYTILYLISLGLMGLCLVVPQSWLLLLTPLIIICNYSPPFISSVLLRSSSLDMDLSSSMVERLGLFSIIVFGEVVLGVVNGINNLESLDFNTWLNFALALSIVFVLWWLFFTLISNRKVKSGFLNATLVELLYIPILVSLGLIAICFSSFFGDSHVLQQVFGYAVAIFHLGINMMLSLLEFPSRYQSIRRPTRFSLLITALIFFGSTFFEIHWNTSYFLGGVLIILLVEIILLNSAYYRLEARSN